MRPALHDRIDSDLLRRFEAGLNPRDPAVSAIPARILGYGEMSTIFAIEAPGQEAMAYKRMPIFRTPAEMDRYEELFREYNTRLGDVGLTIPAFHTVRVIPARGNLVIYNAQARMPAASICNRLIHHLPDEAVDRLFRLVLKELHKVFAFNSAQGSLRFGIDGQISNWAVLDYRDGLVIDDNTRLAYLDTSTPLMQKDGREQLDPELFLRSTPSFLVWIVRLFFLQEVMTRYYDFRKVTIDLIANFYKEQLPGLIPMLIAVANGFFAGEARAFGLRPLTTEEVRAYYREDAMIWRTYLGLRRIDRFLHRWILHAPYAYILPGKIKR